MTSSRRGALPAFLLFFVLPAARAAAAIFALYAPFPAICVTDPGASYAIQRGLLHPIKGAFSISPFGEKPLWPRIAAPQEAQPGQLLRFSISSGDALDGVSFTLKGPGGRMLSVAPGFRTATSDTGEQWAALLGVPSDAAIGTCTLTLKMTSGLRSCLLVKPLTLKARVFGKERFSLSKELTSLVTAPDYRKTVESQTLARVLATPHFDAFFETGALEVPLPSARRTSRYGDRRVYVWADSSTTLSIHEGVDLASPAGTEVPACGSGRVVFAFKRRLTGNTIVIEHLPGLFSLYFHLSSMTVAAGDVVKKGQIIGQVGMTGFATGPHLHWEVQAMGVSVDPDALTRQPLLDKNPDFRDIGSRDSDEGR